MKQTVASIDLGSHTVRLLIARRPGPSGPLKPLIRERAYIRLAEGLGAGRKREIGRKLQARVLEVMGGFSRLLADFEVEEIRGVATGVIRDVGNGDQLLELIRRECGIPIRLISGETEALLSGRGAVSGLGFTGPGCLVFDLGGGTTEFFLKNRKMEQVKSLALGSAVLTRGFLKSDPPLESELHALATEVAKGLGDAGIDFPRGGILIGTGGTATTLAVMLNRIPGKEIGPERVNGLELKYHHVASLLKKMAGMDLEHRAALDGLDPERANVIVAGTVVVLGIMGHVGASTLTVSMSDLLEGLLIGDC